MLISRYGTTAVTMDTIAKECGISKRTIYELFSDKSNLVAETIAWENARMMEKFAKNHQTAPTLYQQCFS